MFANLAAYDGPVIMVSITAPGADRLPWDEYHCAGRHSRGGDHSGKRGCRVEQQAAREWSETATMRYADLRRAAAVHVRRHAPVSVTLLERVWEPQKRGVPHLHLVLGAKTREEIEAAAEFVAKLKELAPSYDFGNVDARGKKGARGERIVARGQILRLTKTEDVARYLSSYLTGRSKHKPAMRETLVDPAMTALAGQTKRQLLPLVWMTPALSSLSRKDRARAARERIGLKVGTGVTMRSLRRARHIWASAVKGFCELPKWTDIFEAVYAGAAYRRAFGARGESSAGPPLEQELGQAFDLAAAIAARIDAIPERDWRSRMRAEEQAREFGDVIALQLAGLRTNTDETLAVAA